MTILTFKVFGAKPYLHFFFLAFCFMPFGLWTTKKILVPIIIFTINLLLFIVVEFYAHNFNVLIDFPNEILIPFKILNVVSAFLLIYFILWLYSDLNEKKEIELYEQKSILIKQNTELEKSHLLIQNQKEELLQLNSQLHDNLQELLENKEELIQANSTKDTFFSIIAHDIKNPLFGFTGLLELLHKNIDKYDQVKIKEHISVINTSASQLKMLVVDLLTWARTQNKSMKAKPTYFLLPTIIHDELQIAAQSINNKQIKVIVAIQNEKTLYLDKDMIQTVFRNLLSNAIKFTSKQGTIIITAYEKELKYFLSIQDTGVGMDSQQIDNLFKIDKVQSNPGTDYESGSGLGLLICNEFITLNNCKLVVKSEVDKGTCFTIEFP